LAGILLHIVDGAFVSNDLGSNLVYSGVHGNAFQAELSTVAEASRDAMETLIPGTKEIHPSEGGCQPGLTKDRISVALVGASDEKIFWVEFGELDVGAPHVKGRAHIISEGAELHLVPMSSNLPRDQRASREAFSAPLDLTRSRNHHRVLQWTSGEVIHWGSRRGSLIKFWREAKWSKNWELFRRLNLGDCR
jgi:hypothetical protein